MVDPRFVRGRLWVDRPRGITYTVDLAPGGDEGLVAAPPPTIAGRP